MTDSETVTLEAYIRVYQPVCMYVCMYMYVYVCMCNTAIPIIIEGHETAFNGFKYQFTTGKPLKNLTLTLNYYGNGSMNR